MNEDKSIKIKRKPDQVTFKDPEIYASLKKLADNDGSGQVGPKAKELIKSALSLQVESSEAGSNVVSEAHANLDISNKIDLVIQVLAELVLELKDEGQVRSSEHSSEDLYEAIREHEELLRANHLMLRFTPEQKGLFIKTMEFRKERGEKHSESIEALFFHMMFKVFYKQNWWDSTPEGFDQEFKEAFSVYFE